MSKREVPLDQMVRSIVREIQPRYPSTRVTYSELPIIDADPGVVRQVLSQVIEKAFRYSALSPKPAVEISIDATGTLQVIDSGPGAPSRRVVSFGD